MEPRPDPQNIRDLRLMYETASRIDGIIEHKNLMPDVMSSREYHDGDITSIQLRVIPSSYYDMVSVCVQRTQVTNLREDGSYSPRRLTDWLKEYTFQEFKESPFYQMCIDVWGNRSGLVTQLFWDTSKMDDHEVIDEDTRWYVYAHVYEHHRTWSNNWDKTGRIEAVDFSLDEDTGAVSIESYEEWLEHATYKSKIPSWCSVDDFYEYFKPELEAIYEDEREKAVAEAHNER